MCIVFVRHVRVAVVENNPTFIYLFAATSQNKNKNSIVVNAVVRYVSLALSPFNREIETNGPSYLYV